MPTDDSRRLTLVIYDIVRAIPPGCVASYGQIAVLAGKPNGPRQVGHALQHAPPDVPCHRVVAHNGRLVPGWAEQRCLLEAEGVTFLPSGRANCKKHRWR